MDARQLADKGARRAVEHADRELFRWSDEAIDWVKVATRTMPAFTTSFVRDMAKSHGFPEAPDARAWGAVMKRAAKEGIVKPTDRFICAGRAISHGRPERVWERA